VQDGPRGRIRRDARGEGGDVPVGEAHVGETCGSRRRGGGTPDAERGPGPVGRQAREGLDPVGGREGQGRDPVQIDRRAQRADLEQRRKDAAPAPLGAGPREGFGLRTGPRRDEGEGRAARHGHQGGVPGAMDAGKTDALALGIETSCDETAAAVVRRRADGTGEIISDIVFSQWDDHAAYGGVVPEIAARAHADRLDALIERAVAEAGVSFGDLDCVAATAGPGLVGGVMVGLATAKAIALAHSLPLVPVNHLEAHALSARLLEETAFPFLLLLVSGGHTQLIAVDGVGAYRRLGTTMDDAAGEAFDKTAKLLGLPHPGGPAVERTAAVGDAARFEMPRPLLKQTGCDFSFSGMKTAVRVAAGDAAGPDGRLSERDVADLCASFQAAAAEHLAARTTRAMALMGEDGRRLVVAGGVAANGAIRARLDAACAEEGFRLIAPPPRLCTDNGAMVAWAGLERRAAGLAEDPETAYRAPARARWPLDPTPRGKAYGSGRKGAKA